MHKTLIQKAFKKAKKDLKEKGKNKPSFTNKAEAISDYIDSVCNYNIGERTLREYFNNAIDLNTENIDLDIKQLEVVNGLCNYLGFETYQDFKDSLHETNSDEKTSPLLTTIKGNSINIFIKNKKIIIAFGIIVCTFFIINKSLKNQRWMIWKQDHYVEVQLDFKKYNNNQLKKYNQKLIDNFKKINSPDCNTECLTEDGKAKVWYWKKNNEEIEVFTTFGYHPETGKELKPITRHMIRKYICGD